MRILTLSILASLLVLTPQSNAKSVMKPKGEPLPEDFSLIHKSWDIGVLPQTTKFIEIKRDAKAAKGTYVLIMRSHTTATGDQPEENKTLVKESLTEAQCMLVYQDVLQFGFFDLKDKYEKEEDGGGGESMTITAKGKTKTVKAINMDLSVIRTLLARVRALLR